MIKKYFLLLLPALFLLGGCSQEDRAKANNFWLGKLGKSAQKIAQTIENEKPAKAIANIPVASRKELSPIPAEQIDTAAYKPLKAMLFVSPNCGRCQRLKQDGWAEKFKQQYDGKIILTEYDLSIPKNKELLHNMMRKHKMTRINYPSFFIGSSVAHGYPLAQKAEKITQKELAAHLRKNPIVPQKPLPQIMEITMESDEIEGKASEQDLARMKRAFDAVQKANQETLADIELTFGKAIKNKAFVIITNTEKQLKSEAQKAADFPSYFQKQKAILAGQNAKINSLLQQNISQIKTLK